MRAVNLIPSEGRAGAASKSGGLHYVVLGALAVLVAFAAMWALAGRDASRSRAELAQVQERTAEAQRTAAPLIAYQALAQVGKQRIDLVKGVDAARYDWSELLEATARVMPANVRLMSLTGLMQEPTPAPAAAAPAPPAGGSAPKADPTAPTAAAAVAPAPPAAPTPSVELTGCAPDLAVVAKLVPRMKLIPGVTGVSLGPATVPSKGTASETAECPGATFALSLSFAAPVAAPATTQPTNGAIAPTSEEQSK